MQWSRPTIIALFGLRPEIGGVPEGLGQDLPASDGLLGFGRRVPLGGRVSPGAEEAMLAHGIEVVHGSWHNDLAAGLVDFLALEHPEAETPQAGRARGRVGDGANARVG